MKKLVLALFLATSAHAVDPLDASFYPSINTDAASYATAFGTITITDSLYKVFQSSIAPGNYKWFASSSAYMMRNEILSFQVHATPSVPITSFTVSMSNLTNAQTGTVISSSTADIIVYREYYMNISTPSSVGSSYYNFRAMMPDQLIPENEPYYHQTTNAFPVSIAANKTQSAWIDIHAATSVPSGYYQGSVYVSSGNVVVSTMPVVIGVWNWIMPSNTTLGGEFSGFEYDGMCNVSYGGAGSCGAYPNSGGSDSANTQQWIDGTKLALDHRVGVYNPANAALYPSVISSFGPYVTRLGPLLNGTTSVVLPGPAMTNAKLQTTVFNSSEWQTWVDTFTLQGWGSKLNHKLCDEPPNGCTWAQLISSGTASRSYSTPIVPNMVTTSSAAANENNALYVIDWIVPNIVALDNNISGNHRDGYDYFLSQSSGATRRIGAYQSCESAGSNGCTNGVIGDTRGKYPNLHIDGKPLANRAFETWAYTNRVGFEHYFALDYCSAHNCPSAVNPWSSVYAFGANGDGTLVYPSSPTIVTTSSNIPIWVPSIRLKHIRDGFQDYEYANYLATHGQTSFADTQIATWMTNAYTFSTDPDTFQAARYAMGNKIHQMNTVKMQFFGGVRIEGGILLP